MLEKSSFIASAASTGPNAFALEVIGDSMSPDFPNGSIIVVDPDLMHNQDSFVIAEVDGVKTFRQICTDGTVQYLKPINPQYPVKELNNSKIIGVVVESISIKSLI